MNPNLAMLNALPEELAEAALLACCGSAIWARRMAHARPFDSIEAVQSEAEHIWWDLAKDDWLQAFAAHPKIGKKKAQRANEQSRTWSEKEQTGIAGASSDTMQKLADGNTAYEKRFGYIYIVCATGKSADEMLALLRGRLQNDADTELKIAAGEQAKITRLRLEKFLGGT
jgi:OHCU decarboxylase